MSSEFQIEWTGTPKKPDTWEIFGDDTYTSQRQANAAIRGARTLAGDKAFRVTPVEDGPGHWLMWVGSVHYDGIDAYADEALTLGVSKRVASPALAQRLAEPGTLIFVAHDEGEFSECSACHGELECPECRKSRIAIDGLQEFVATFRGRYGAEFDAVAPGMAKRTVRIREARIRDLEALIECCDICGGKEKYHGGTGGTATLKNGEVWDYRRYMYHRNQPKKWSMDQVASLDMCATCGGFGKERVCKIFGVFAPEKAEYIIRGDETKEQLDKLGLGMDFVRTTKGEPKRLCGKRKAGGSYVVTSSGGKASPEAISGLEKLVEAGLPVEDSEISGSFVRFPDPIITTRYKRFRSIKRIEPEALLADVGAQAMEALE